MGTTTRIADSVAEECSVSGCRTVAKTDRLCNTHYMARYRQLTRDLEKEQDQMWREYGVPEEYDCYEEDCAANPVRWFAPGGKVKDAVALCAEHSALTASRLRLDIRRLEDKQDQRERL